MTRLCIFSLALAWAAVLSGQTTAFTWTPANPAYSHLSPFYWIGTYNAGSVHHWSNFAATKTALDALPAGRRAIFIWDIHRWMHQDPRDHLTDSLGNVVGFTTPAGIFKPYHGPWWDAGADSIATFFDNWFHTYDSLGGKLDLLVLDYEDGFSNWHLSNYINALLGADKTDSLVTDYWLKIAADPRYPALDSLLSFDDILKVRFWWQNGYEYLEFNALMQQRRADYINHAIYEQAIKYFPAVKMSNYADFYWNIPYGIREGNGHPYYLYGDGAAVGTHQSEAFYGWLGQITLPGRFPEAGPVYAGTPYHSFQYCVNQARSIRLCHPAPLVPWFANHGFDDGGKVHFAGKDYWQEMVFHTLLTGTDDVLFWNPYASDAENLLMDQLLAQFDAFWTNGGPPAPAVLQDSLLSPWAQDFVLSRLENDSLVVWRLTPEAPEGFDLNALVLDDDPATFQLTDTTLVLPGQIFYPATNLSDKGWWVVCVKPQLAIAGPDAVCPGQPVVYSVENLPNMTYLWMISANGEILSGQGTNAVTVRWNDGAGGSLTVTVGPQ